MKKLIFILGLGLIIGMVNINNTEAQVHVSINIDIQPAWGPSGYNYAEYYYIPEINVYYDVVNQMYYYNNRGRWISCLFLPVAYSYYDFYSLYKVVLNGILHPWNYNRRHYSLYSGYRHNYNQMPIFYMRDTRYHRARSNYHGWVEPRYMPKNNGRPHSHDYSMNTRNGRINDSRSTAPNNRRETINSRSSRNDATMNNRSSNNRNELRNNSAANNNNRRGNDASVRSNSNNNRNNDTSVRSNTNNRRSNDTSVKSGRSESGNNSKITTRSNDTRSNNTSVRSNNKSDKNNNSSVSSRSNSRSNDSSVRSSSRGSDNKSSTSQRAGKTNRQESSRSGRR